MPDSPRPAPPRPEPTKDIGTVIGEYELLRELATGGMGSVWAARKVDDEKPTLYAVKRLKKHIVSRAGMSERIAQACEIAAKIEHPNVVAPTEFVHRDGELCIVTELLEAETLKGLMRLSGEHKMPIPANVIVRIGLDVLAGLEAGHALQSEGEAFIHGDLSPENVFVTTGGVAKLLDFGLAKPLHGTLASPLKNREKAGYQAPEQIRGKEVPDARADVFAVGVLLWELFARERLFESKYEGAVAQKVLAAPIARLDALDKATKFLAAVVMKALQRDRNQRYQSAREMAEALEEAAAGKVASAEEVAIVVDNLAGVAIAQRNRSIEQATARRDSRPTPTPAPAVARPAPPAPKAAPPAPKPAPSASKPAPPTPKPGPVAPKAAAPAPKPAPPAPKPGPRRPSAPASAPVLDADVTEESAGAEDLPIEVEVELDAPESRPAIEEVEPEPASDPTPVPPAAIAAPSSEPAATPEPVLAPTTPAPEPEPAAEAAPVAESTLAPASSPEPTSETAETPAPAAADAPPAPEPAAADAPPASEPPTQPAPLPDRESKPVVVGDSIVIAAEAFEPPPAKPIVPPPPRFSRELEEDLRAAGLASRRDPGKGRTIVLGVVGAAALLLVAAFALSSSKKDDAGADRPTVAEVETVPAAAPAPEPAREPELPADPPPAPTEVEVAPAAVVEAEPAPQPAPEPEPEPAVAPAKLVEAAPAEPVAPAKATTPASRPSQTKTTSRPKADPKPKPKATQPKAPQKTFDPTSI